MKELDLSNAEGLDESITENYSAIAPRLLRGTAQVAALPSLAVAQDAATAAALPSLAVAQDAANLDREEIGDGFFITKNTVITGIGSAKNINIPNLSKKYIDGTIQKGLLIDASGNVSLGEIESVDLGGGKMMARKKLIPYPKDKGFVKSNGKGQYFYFEELPEFIKNEIARLNKLQGIATTNSTFPIKKLSIPRKPSSTMAASATKVQDIQKEAEEESAEKEESTEKTSEKTEGDKILGMPKMVAYGLGAVIVLVGGFIAYKKFKK